MWDKHRSFYMNLDGSVQFDFKDHLKKKLSLFQGKILSLDLNLREVAVFDREVPLEGDEVEMFSYLITHVQE